MKPCAKPEVATVFLGTFSIHVRNGRTWAEDELSCHMVRLDAGQDSSHIRDE